MPVVCQVFTVIPLNLYKYLRVLVVDLNYGKEQTEAMKYRLFSQGLRNWKSQDWNHVFSHSKGLLPLAFSRNLWLLGTVCSFPSLGRSSWNAALTHFHIDLYLRVPHLPCHCHHHSPLTSVFTVKWIEVDIFWVSWTSGGRSCYDSWGSHPCLSCVQFFSSPPHPYAGGRCFRTADGGIPELPRQDLTKWRLIPHFVDLEPWEAALSTLHSY